MRRTEKAALVSTAAYGLLGGGMVAVAVVSGSVSLMAEGIHTFTDCVTSAAVWIGLRLSERHTRTFPFGLYKLENLIAAVIGILILLTAYELASESISKLGESQGVERPALVLVIMGVSMAVIGLLAWYKNKVGREENSPGLRADARNSMADVAAASAVFIGVGLEMAGIPRMDSIAALVVVVFLVWAGIEVAFNGIKVLLDASIEKEILNKVSEIAEAHHGVKKVIDVEGRNSGSYRFIDVTVIPRSRDLAKASHVTDEVRDAIRREITNVDRVRINLEVQERDSVLCAVPLEEGGQTVSVHFGEAPTFRLLEVGIPTGDILSRETLGNPFSAVSKGKGVKVAEFLAQQEVELLLVRESLEGKGSHYALEAQGILEIFRPEVESLEDAERSLSELAATGEIV